MSMHGPAWLSMVCAITLAVLPSAGAQSVDTSTVYPTLADALNSKALNTSTYALFVTLQSLNTTFADPSQQMIVLAPVEKAYASFLKDYPFEPNLLSAGQSTLLHAIPTSTPQAQLQLSTSGPTTLPTLRSTSPLTSSDSLPNLTFVPTNDPHMYYVGGLQGGAMVNISRSWVAGQGRIYLVEHLLVMPSTSNIPSSVMPGLTVASAISAIDPQVLGSLSLLVAADRELTALLSNPDQVVTLLAPTNTALKTYLTSLGVFDINAFKGTPAAAMLLRSHVVPGRPWISSALNPTIATNVPLWGSNHTVKLTLGPPANNRPFTMGVQGSGNPQQLVVTTPDLAAGKSCMHIVNGVVLTGAPLPPLPPAALVPLPDPLLAAPSPASATDSKSSNKSNTVPPGALAGIILGSVCFAVLLVVIVGLLFVRCKRFSSKSGRIKSVRKFHYGGSFWTLWSMLSHQGEPRDKSPPDEGCGRDMTRDGAVVLAVPMFQAEMPRPDAIAAPPHQIPGLIYGDPFITSAAPQYSWTDRVHDTTCVGVEAHINDQQLDKLSAGGRVEPPVVRLSRAEVMQQIRLMKDGLLGQGASAFVFKGLWPNRFGPNAVLAIKLLKNPYEADPTVYEGICYEAAVLSTVRHPNVLRLYGYCLELPTACLIMELLPSSLKDRLYSYREAETADETSELTSVYTNTHRDSNRPAAAAVDPLVSTAAWSPHVTGFTMVDGMSQCNAYVPRASRHLTSTDVNTGAWDVSRAAQGQGQGQGQVRGWPRPGGDGARGHSTEVLSGSRHPRASADVTTMPNNNIDTSPVKALLFRTQPLDTMPEEEGPTVQLLDRLVVQDSSREATPGPRSQSPAKDGPVSYRLPEESEAAKLFASATSHFASAQGKFSEAGSKFSSATDAAAKFSSATDAAAKFSSATDAAAKFSSATDTAPKVSVKPVIRSPAPPSMMTTRTIDVTDTTIAAAAPVVKTQGSNSPVLLRGSVEIEDLEQSPRNTDATLDLGMVGQVATPRLKDVAAASSSSANHSTKTKSTLTATNTGNGSLSRMTVLEMLTVAADVAAGLAYLHKRPAVVVLPQHPQLMLSDDPLATGVKAGNNPLAQDPATDEDGNMSIARIVHRDLKPSNILINSRGRAKISDFGLARWHSSSTVYTHHLGVGTLRYMAPELLLGHYTQPNAHTITNRVDIYSLGMLMYEMLSGRLPWNDLSDVQIVGAVISGARPPLSPNADAGNNNNNNTKDISHKPASFETLPQMRALVARCWHEKYHQRPTASEVHKVITTMLNMYS